jgi:hypothetical protein
MPYGKSEPAAESDPSPFPPLQCGEVPMEPRYHPGQVWRYKNAVREDSRAIVGQVEDLPGSGTVVSICVTNVYLPHVQTGEPTLNAISRAPMMPGAMDISVTEQTGTGEPIPEFADARAEWRALIAKKFIIPVADVVKYLAEAMTKETYIPD